MIRRCVSLLLAAACLVPAVAPGVCHASDETAGTFGAAFLQIPVGPRAITVPGVVAEMRPDASLLFTNPASLANMRQGGLFVSTASWLDEFNFTAASLATPIKPGGLTLSLGSRVLYAGGLQGYNASSQVVEDESFYDMALTSGLSKRFDRLGLAVGAGMTYVREHLPGDDGSGFTYSFGVSSNIGNNRLTLSVENAAGRLKFAGRDYVIANRMVAGYGRVVRTGLGSLDLGAEVSVSESAYERFRIGGTYNMSRYLSLSGGYDHTAQSTSHVAVPFSAGMGVHFDRFWLNYAYTPQEYFSSTHTVALAISFGESHSVQPTTARSREPRVPPPTPAPTPAAETATQVPNPRPATSTADAPVTGAFAVVAGMHSRLESARAEVRALRLLKVPAVIQTTSEGKYRVVIVRCDTLAEAEKAVAGFEKKGHRFAIIEGPE